MSVLFLNSYVLQNVGQSQESFIKPLNKHLLNVIPRVH